MRGKRNRPTLPFPATTGKLRHLWDFDLSEKRPIVVLMNLRSCAFALPLLAAGILAGCYSSTTSLGRIDANRALYESWPIDMQQAVLDQRIIAGMDPDMVRMALGEPTEINTRPDPRSRAMEEVWIYRKGGGGGGGGLRNTSVSVGGGTGGVYVGGSPIALGGGGGGYIPDENVVVFQNGKVKSSTLSGEPAR